MKRLICALSVFVLSTATVVYAQQPAPSGDASRPPGQAQPGGMPMMEMCREMMAAHGMTGGGMTGGHMMGGPGMMGGREMMGGGMGMMGPGMMGGDPRMMGHMLEMRGEIMKAVGDVMIKHAQKMQQMPPPPK